MRRALPLSVLLLSACTAAAPEDAAPEQSHEAALKTVILIEDHADHAVERSVVMDARGEYRDVATTARGLRPIEPVQDERLLAVRVAWAHDASICTMDAIEETLFAPKPGTVATWLRETSHGRATLSGDVVGTITIDRTDTCQPGVWATQIEAALVAQGVDLSAYNRRMYFLPGAACGWAGLGELGGVRSWINGGACNHRPTVAHELGHTLGMHHASTPTAEYGDLSDPMGGGGAGLVGVNAPHAYEMGWIEAEPITMDGSAAIVALAEGGGLRAIRGSSHGDPWFISLRTAIRHDANINAPYRDVVSVHRAAPFAHRQTMLHARLAVGETFLADDASVEVTVLSITGDAATVAVRLPCQDRAPRVYADDRFDLVPGGSVTVPVTLVNEDRGSCGVSSFSLTDGGAPSGLTIAFDVARIAVAPGETARANATVTAPLGAPPGEQVVDAAISRRGGAGGRNSLSAFVDTQAPSVPVNFQAVVPDPRQNAVVLSMTLWPDDSSRLGVELERDGVVVVSMPDVTRGGGFVELTDKPVPYGFHTYRARAFDRAGQRSDWSDPATVWVQARR